MTGTEMKNVIVCILVVVVGLFVLYQYDPTLFGLMSYEGFFDEASDKAAKEAADKAAKDAADKAKAEADKKAAEAAKSKSPFVDVPQGFTNEGYEEKDEEGFANLGGYEGPAQFSSSQPPAGCYPRDQLTPSELLPKDQNTVWAEQNPMGPGSLKGKNFLSAGALIGVNTVGQSMRNANLQVRSEPPNPQVAVSIFNQSTISPDISHRPLEIGA
jgi:hypothetical protein